MVSPAWAGLGWVIDCGSHQFQQSGTPAMDMQFQPPTQDPSECSFLEDSFVVCLKEKLIKDEVPEMRCKIESFGSTSNVHSASNNTATPSNSEASSPRSRRARASIAPRLRQTLINYQQPSHHSCHTPPNPAPTVSPPPLLKVGLALRIYFSLIMQQHQHGPNCQHGPAHGGGGHAHRGGHQQVHGHGGGPGPMHMMGMGGQPQDESPQEYFQNLRKRWDDKESRVFCWQQLLHGVVLDRLYDRLGLDFMRSLTCQAPQMIILGIENMLSFEWMPSRLRPFTSGLFFPLLFLLFFSYNVVVGVNAPDQLLRGLTLATLVLYALVALRGHSSLKTEAMKQKSKEAFQVRPYIQNPQMSCQACGVLKLFRAAHCPYCKTCVGKHSRHSLVFGSCIGAANELLALLFFLVLSLTLARVLLLFWQGSSYGTLTKVMFYLLNVPFCWMSLVETLQFIVFNLLYGVTEQELKMWPMMQYLQKIPDRGFQNNVGQGFSLNLQGSLMALFGVGGFESEEGWAKPQLVLPNVDGSRSYRVNWDKAVIYLIPQMPFHRNRGQILQMMQRDEPRMIEMFRMQARFREQIKAEEGSEQLNEFQLQQKLAMKMQQHMMKNMPQMAAPSPDQQKAIQLQMLAHMKKDFATEPDLHLKITQLESNLKDAGLAPIEANMQMRALQQQLMSRRINASMKQAKVKADKGKEEEEETPMRNMADEDL